MKSAMDKVGLKIAILVMVATVQRRTVQGTAQYQYRYKLSANGVLGLAYTHQTTGLQLDKIAQDDLLLAQIVKSKKEMSEVDVLLKMKSSPFLGVKDAPL